MRRIVEADIEYISLVPKGANRLPAIYKAETGGFELSTLLKLGDDFMEKGELTAIVYAPEMRDSQGDIASAEVIKDMMYRAAQRGLKIDMRHDESPLAKEQAYIAESFIVQKGDARFASIKDYDGKPVDVTGAWATVIKIEDKSLRQLYKDGKWQGVSMGGKARLQADKSDDIADAVAKKLAQKMGLTSEEFTMDKKEADEMIAKATATIATEVAKAVAEAMKPPVKKDDTKPADTAPAALPCPVFKGDYSDTAAVAKHAESVKRWKLAKEVDWTDADSILKYNEELAKLAPAAATDTKKADDGETEEVKGLKKQLEEAQKRSNVAKGGAANDKTPADKGTENIAVSKEDADLGKRMAGMFK